MSSRAEGADPAGEPAHHVDEEPAQQDAAPPEAVGERTVDELRQREPREEQRHRELDGRGRRPERLGGGREGRQRHVDRQRADGHHGREQDGNRTPQAAGRSRRVAGREVRRLRGSGSYGSTITWRAKVAASMLVPQTIAPDPPAAEALAQRTEERGGGRGARRLDRELDPAEQEPHGAPKLVVAHQHEIVERAAAQLEAVRRRVGRAQAVGDRAHRLDRLRLSGREAPPHRVRALRLDPEDLAAGQRQLDRRRDAGAEAAAADRHDHRVEVRGLGRELEPEGGRAERRARPLERVDEGAGPRRPRSRGRARTPGARRRRGRPRRPTTGTRRREPDSPCAASRPWRSCRGRGPRSRRRWRGCPRSPRSRRGRGWRGRAPA